MSGKTNNRILLLVFVILAAIFIITRFTRVKKSSRTLVTDIVQIDTSLVSTVQLYPSSENGNELLFNRNEGLWTVASRGIEASASDLAFKGLLGELQNLKVQQLVSRSSDSHQEYQVTDSLGTRIIIKEGNKTTLDLVVGRFHYEPAPGGNNMYGQNRGTGKSYLRLYKENEVYSVEGFIAMGINQPFERWRDQSITRLNSEQLTKITFDYPADSGFVAQKSGDGWMVAGLAADSLSMATYLNKVTRLSDEEFADDFKPGSDPDFVAIFEGDNMKTQQVRGFIQENNQVFLNSSINSDTWFKVQRDGIFADLFSSANQLLKGAS